jgi:hypothetical protein
VRWALVCLLLTSASLVAESGGGQASHVFLREKFALTAGDVEGLDHGRVVVKSLKSEDRREMGAVGAVKLNVPADYFLSRFSNIVSFKQSPLVRQVGKFSDPPTSSDLARLVVDTSEIEAIHRCKIGDCGLQLGRDDIRRARTEIDWNKPDARERAAGLLRQTILEYVRAYRENGNSSLPEYLDKNEAVSVRREIGLLLGHSSVLLSDTPDLHGYLLGSSPKPAGAEEFLYWSKEQFGLKPVISATHVVMYRKPGAQPQEFIIASKQIYASRYFSGSLALTLGVRDTTWDPVHPSFYVLYSNRTRPCAIPPMLGIFIRPYAQAQTKSGMEEQLRLTKERLEADYQKIGERSERTAGPRK